LKSPRDNYSQSKKPVFKRFFACLQAFSYVQNGEKSTENQQGVKNHHHRG